MKVLTIFQDVFRAGGPILNCVALSNPITSDAMVNIADPEMHTVRS